MKLLHQHTHAHSGHTKHTHHHRHTKMANASYIHFPGERDDLDHVHWDVDREVGSG